jgi:ferredoxin-NADP reductase
MGPGRRVLGGREPGPRSLSERSALFRTELDRIAAGRGARVHYLVGKDVGPFTPELFHRLVPGLVSRDVYLCGPPGLSDAVRHALQEAGLPPEQFHEERFAF